MVLMITGSLKISDLLYNLFSATNLLSTLAQTQMQKSVAARSLLFSPGGPLAKELSRHGVVLRVNDWLFAHGGILPHHGE